MMNKKAQQHIAKAADYIAKGDEFYRKAKPEIDAAYEAGATQQEIADGLAMYGTVRSRKWVSEVLAWDGVGTLYGNDTDRRRMDMAKQVLRESSPETISTMLDDPVISRNIIKGATLHEDETQDRERASQSQRTPRLVTSARVNDSLTGLVAAKVGLGRTLRELQKAPALSSRDREDFLAILGEIRLELDWIESFLTAGTLDIDSELREILEGV